MVARRVEDRYLRSLTGIDRRPSAGHRFARPRHPPSHPGGNQAVGAAGGPRQRARGCGRHSDRSLAGARRAQARPADHERDQPRCRVPDAAARDLRGLDRRTGSPRRGDRDRSRSCTVLCAPEPDARGLGRRRGLHRGGPRAGHWTAEADGPARAAERGGTAVADADADDGRRTARSGRAQPSGSRCAAAFLRLGRHAHRGSPADLRHADRRRRAGGRDHPCRARVQPARRDARQASGEARWDAPAEAGGATRRSGTRTPRARRGAGRRWAGDGAGRAGPHRVVPRRLGSRARHLDHGRARRDRGHRGRVGFGEEPDRDGDRGTPASPERRRRPSGAGSSGATFGRSAQEHDAG